MNDKIKRALELRKTLRRKRPSFERQDAPNLSRLKSHWRRPKGLQSKRRLQKRGHGALVRVGYRTPVLARFMHRQGKLPVIINNHKELMALDVSKQTGVIASCVGMRKRQGLVRIASEKNIPLLNVKDPKAYLESVKKYLEDKKKHKQASLEEKLKKKEEAEKKEKGTKKKASTKKKTSPVQKDKTEKQAEEENQDNKDSKDTQPTQNTKDEAEASPAVPKDVKKEQKKEFDKLLTKRDTR